MDAKVAAQLLARIFSRYPTFAPDADRQRQMLAVWSDELGQVFAQDDPARCYHWAVEVCRQKASPFPPALDELVRGMKALRGRERAEIEREERKALEAPITAERARLNVSRVQSLVAFITGKGGETTR